MSLVPKARLLYNSSFCLFHLQRTVVSAWWIDQLLLITPVLLTEAKQREIWAGILLWKLTRSQLLSVERKRNSSLNKSERRK